MNYYINQTIQINLIKINAIANSSVVQIGSAGIIKPVSKIENSTEAIEQIAANGVGVPFKILR